jgi:3D (Asp-Asp-Asp) domain-containing protein
VRGRRETRRAPAYALVAAVGFALAGAGSGAADHGATATRPGQLGTREHAVLLSLYSLDQQIANARSRVASLEHRLAGVRAERARAALAAAIARRAWTDSVDALGAHLRAIYEQDESDALAIFFGSSSIDDAVTRLDALRRSAQLNQQTIEQTRAARAMLRRLQSELATRTVELQTLLAQARDTAAALERRREQRVAYMASLRRQRQWTARRIARVDAVAQRSVDHPERTNPEVAVETPAPAPAPVSAGQTLSVSATGYSLGGTTATGLPVGWGVVAVDPGVIPLGTRMTIPGYGEGVAADTGSAIRGYTIDLWFPTRGEALAWGRRTLTITIR